jgi:predicted NBD/HSP70 family sugar kinase
LLGTGPRCDLGHRGCTAAYLSRAGIEARVSEESGTPTRFADLVRAEGSARSAWHADAARALGHLVATFAGALQTEHIVLAGEDAESLVADPAMTTALADRLRPGPAETQRCALDVSAAPLTFTIWARGAAVVSLQHSLGGL